MVASGCLRLWNLRVHRRLVLLQEVLRGQDSLPGTLMVVMVVVVGLYLCVLAPDMHLSYTSAHTHTPC